MSNLIRIAFLGSFFFTLNGKILAANPVLDADEVEALLNAEDYEMDDDVYIPPYLWKRSGFWVSHPSDFNPMRRPTAGQSGGGGRATKKSENPYHPVPRSTSIGQKNQRSNQSPSNEELEALIEGLRDKRQSPGSFLLMKLGRMSKQQQEKSGDVNRRLGRRRA